MYNTFIFDIDGTLLDTEQASLGSLQQCLQEYDNREVALEELYFSLGIPGVNALQQLGIEDVEQVLDRWEMLMKDYFHKIGVYGGIDDMLAQLANYSVQMGVVTSKTSQELLDDFEPFGLATYVSHVICADDTTLHKPNPEPMMKFLEISGAEASSSIYIGDTIYDYQCAMTAGVDFGLVLWSCKNPDMIPVKYKFEKPEDILGLLNH